MKINKKLIVVALFLIITIFSIFGTVIVFKILKSPRENILFPDFFP